MSIACIEALPEVQESFDDEGACITCCRDDVALCGADLTGSIEDAEPIDEERDCEACVNRDRLDLPCGAPFCGLRRRWRRWFS